MTKHVPNSPVEFLRRIASRPMTILDRAVGLLWLRGVSDRTQGHTARELADILHSAGYPEQNVSRLDRGLKEDRRTVRARPHGWRLTPQAREVLDGEFAFATIPAPLPHTDSVLPKDIVRGTRGYIERVVEQINKSFDAELYDCTAVMCRRLLETLVIEVYENQGRANDLKGGDGHFMMLSGLLDVFDKDKTIHMGRGGMAGLRGFKALGDLSAHNRRFNARRTDIERIRDGLRIAVEELVHLAHFKPATPEPVSNG